ncbi:OmpA family protein [Novosphingobium bradum]|uniref:OmpA family protein n=1 Tax=Novosphingobium bradum TaxID=1737444 RepID=A0ABV7IML7_9SPHN
MFEVTLKVLRGGTLLGAPLLAGAMLLAQAAQAAPAHDVRPYSADDANVLLNTPIDGPAPSQASCGPREILLDDGTCAATRAFSIAKMGTPAPAAQLTTRPASPPRAQLAPGKARSAVSAPRAAARAPGRQDVPLQFAMGSTELTPQSKANLVTLAKALAAPQHRAKRVRIVGHTDRSGRRETNLALSQRRADAAAEFLAGQGVDRARIDTLGVADTVMIEGVSPFDGRQRRVEITRSQ